jgi:signal transduction histidine kinase
VRHADASRVNVTLSAMPDRIFLEVIDDGSGFNTDETGDSNFGIRGMHRCADDAGGELIIESKPGKRTTLTVDIPIQEV